MSAARPPPNIELMIAANRMYAAVAIPRSLARPGSKSFCGGGDAGGGGAGVGAGGNGSEGLDFGFSFFFLRLMSESNRHP